MNMNNEKNVMKEKEKDNLIIKEPSIKSKNFNIVLIAMLTALCISVSYILSPLANIELMSFIIFISGFIFGLTVGIGVGTMASLIYYGWNPYGPSNPPIFIACVLCMVLFGVIGGIMRKKDNDKLEYSAWNVYKFGTVGLLLTLLFDLTTNIITGFIFYGGNVIIALVLGIPFLLIHTISNTAVFSGLLIPVVNAIKNLNQFNKV
ncbi:MAG: ECF transporter S component [Candidatus Helarchaeota archaeon]